MFRLPIRSTQVIVKVYQNFISPALHLWIGPTGGCRFEPSCSVYFSEALTEYGLARGLWLGLKRIFRCHPWSRAGYDPLPRVIAKTCLKPNPDQGR